MFETDQPPLSNNEPPHEYDFATSPLFPVAGCFALVATLISLHSIWKHLVNYKKPILQRLIVRILFMPAIYSVSSWLSFGYHHGADVMEPIRDCYEAFVLWMFFQLLINFMDGEGALLERLDDGRLPTPHMFPLNLFMRPVDVSVPRNFILLKRTILQFVFVKPIHTLLIIVLKLSGVYEEGHVSLDSAYIYVSLLYNVSVMICMYGLVLFYMATRYDLAAHKPMLKLLCIKSVIFFSFWQSLILSFMYNIGMIPKDISPAAIQDFIICFEMILAAISHLYAFGHEEYEELESARLPWPSALRDASGFNDLLLDIRHTWRGTNFRQYDALLSDAGSPLLDGENTPAHDRYLRIGTSLTFDDVDTDGSIEELYQHARHLGSDYNYRVISPKSPRATTPPAETRVNLDNL